jgi:molybdopterin converting factor small subunit
VGDEDSELTRKKEKAPNQERDDKGRFLPEHGAYTGHIRRRYSDKRYKEGKQLQAVMDALVDDLGGQGNLTAGQRLLLDTIQSKLIVVLQISQYVDQQAEIIKDGQLLPVLGKNYLAYLNSLRLALDQLYKDNHRSKGKERTLEEICQKYKVEDGNTDHNSSD